jgi:hypothetical protein
MESPGVALKDPAASIGKVIGALAGAGVFLYLIGAVVLWQRLSRAHLQADEVIGAIPRDQVAVLGAREVLLSAVAAASFALFLYGFYWLFRFSERRAGHDGVGGRVLRFMREKPAVLITAIAGSLAVFGPCDAFEAALLVLFLVNVYLGMRSVHRSVIGELPDFRTSIRPWLRVAAGLAIAVLIASVARQHAFPDEFPMATVELSGPRAAYSPMRGLYLGSSGDTIILGVPRHLELGPRCEASQEQGRGNAPATYFLPRSDVERMTLMGGPERCRPPSSIARAVFHLPLECIAPLCEFDGGRARVLLIHGS